MSFWTRLVTSCRIGQVLAPYTAKACPSPTNASVLAAAFTITSSRQVIASIDDLEKESDGIRHQNRSLTHLDLSDSDGDDDHDKDTDDKVYLCSFPAPAKKGRKDDKKETDSKNLTKKETGQYGA